MCIATEKVTLLKFRKFLNLLSDELTSVQGSLIQLSTPPYRRGAGGEACTAAQAGAG